MTAVSGRADGLVVERLAPERVEALVRFLPRAFAGQPSSAGLFAGDDGRRRWEWLNREQPLGLPDGGIPVWICRDGDTILGTVGAFPAELVVRGVVAPFAWARDMVVDPASRGRGIGSALMRRVIDEVGLCGVLGNADVYPLYRRLGFSDAGSLPTLVRVIDAAQVAASVGLPGPARVAAAAALSLLGLRPPRRPPRIAVEVLTDFDERFDRLWGGIEPEVGAVLRRTSATLRWRYVRNPNREYRILGATGGGDLRGVAIIRLGTSRGLPAGFIVELLARPSDPAALDALIDAAAADLLARADAARPALLRTGVLHPTYRAAFVRAGWFPVPSAIRWILASAHGPADLARAGRPAAWLLNSGDSDLDFL